jgi:hypothetical protein
MAPDPDPERAQGRALCTGQLLFTFVKEASSSEIFVVSVDICCFCFCLTVVSVAFVSAVSVVSVVSVVFLFFVFCCLCNLCCLTDALLLSLPVLVASCTG